jgi:hypothetical protein
LLGTEEDWIARINRAMTVSLFDVVLAATFQLSPSLPGLSGQSSLTSGAAAPC